MRKLRRLLAIVCVLTLLLSACQSAPAEESQTDSSQEIAAGETTPAETEAPAVNRDVTVDFVVVGAGAAGISTATEAAHNGQSVIVLEKLPIAGGSSALCEGYFWSTESRLNQETGQGYDTEKMKEYLWESSRGNANQGLLNNLCDVSTEVMNSMLDDGITFLTDRFAASGGDAADLQIFIAEGEGAGLFKGLLSRAEKEGVEIRYESKATDLIYEDGEVKGVTVEDEDGSYNIYASATVLATGGFLRNEELMMEYMPEWYYENPYCGAGSTGDGHVMAMKLGAHMNGYGTGSVWNYDGQNGYHMDGGLTAAVSFFIVNQEGERFCNEYMGTDKNNLVVQQTGRKVYCFMDSTSNYVSIAETGVANGIVYKADTLEELCEIFGIDTETFMQTVADYNAVKESGEDDAFMVPNAYMVSMTQAPFYATCYDPSLTTNCLMGLECDEYCRILDENNEPIPNLYGVGEIIIGSVGGGRYPCCGTCLASGIYGGVIAVRHQLGILE